MLSWRLLPSVVEAVEVMATVLRRYMVLRQQLKVDLLTHSSRCSLDVEILLLYNIFIDRLLLLLRQLLT